MGKITDPAGGGSANVVDATTPGSLVGKKGVVVVDADSASGTSKKVVLNDSLGNEITSTDEGGGVRSLDVNIKSGSSEGPTGTEGTPIGTSGVPTMGKSANGNAEFLPIAEEGSTSPGKGFLIMGTDDTILRPQRIRVNGATVVETHPYLWSISEGDVPGHTTFEHTAFATTATTSRQAIVAGTWNEQSTGSQRSIVSTSGADSAGGTGARKVLIDYIDSSGASLTETVTLNGTTPVNTVATDIKWINDLIIIEAGTGLYASGTISLYSGISGGGVVMGQIISGSSKLQSSYYYVPAGKNAYVTRVSMTTDDKSQTFLQVTEDFSAYGGGSNVTHTKHQIYVERRTADMDFAVPIVLTGGQKFWVEVTPQKTNTFYSIQVVGWEE